MSKDWVRVTKSSPCPICAKPDWCCISADGAVANCMRIEGAKTARNGGWIHRLTNEPQSAPLPPKPQREKPPLCNPSRLLSRWAKDTTQDRLHGLAEALGVSTAALTALGAVWANPRDSWAFPMRNSAGKIIGIRLRPIEGKKHCVEGSSTGLFYPATLPHDAESLFITEGPTDAAAAISLGYHAIGRPSCSGGALCLLSLLDRIQVRSVVIIADNDRPGRRGALRMAAQIAIPFKILTLPAKDLRLFVQAGATRQIVDHMLAMQDFHARDAYARPPARI